MAKRDGHSLWWLPVLVAGGAGAAALAWVATLSQQQPATRAVAREPVVEWLGGDLQANIEGLAYLFASENARGSLLLWALQALAANNWAFQVSRTRPQIKSIADMLRSGIVKPKGTWVHGLDWGPQYDKLKKITRWAATTAGLSRMTVGWRYFEFAQRLLQNRVAFSELRGKRGEVMPAPLDWLRITSFLQYEDFGETVQRQAGADAETDPEATLHRWGDPRLIASVEGVRFYGR